MDILPPKRLYVPESKTARSGGSIFASIAITGHCKAKMSTLHILPTPPVHTWHDLPEALPSKIEDLTNTVPIPRSSFDTTSKTVFLLSISTMSQEATPRKNRKGIIFRDPRHQSVHDFYDTHNDASATPKTSLVTNSKEVYDVWFPPDIRSATLYCEYTNASSAIELDLTTHRSMRPQDVGDGIESRAISEIGPPEETISVVFVSGGFTEKEREKFFKSVEELSNMITDHGMDSQNIEREDSDIHDIHTSAPHSRYWTFWNIYAVFQPSKDSGASRPLHNIKLDNNLECYHPAQIERGVVCSWEKARDLADVSPAEVRSRPSNVLIISLVNTPIYGGTGIYVDGLRHFCNFFNGFDISILENRRKMLSLMVHEIGHAYGGLADEYLRYDEPVTQNIDLDNCEMGNGWGPPALSRWQWWISAYKKDPTKFLMTYGDGVYNRNWGVVSPPSRGCMYPNYYKPNTHCIMNRLNDYHMCPVCREFASINILKNQFSLLWPRTPLVDQVLVVTTNTSNSSVINTESSVTLHLSRYLTKVNGFEVEVTDSDGTNIPLITGSEAITCPACFTLKKSNFAKYPKGEIIYINVTVKDTSKFISDPTKRPLVPDSQFLQRTTFRVMVSDDIPRDTNNSAILMVPLLASIVGKTSSDTIARYLWCTPLTPSKTPLCSLNLPNKVYESSGAMGITLSEYSAYIFAIMAAIGAIFIGLWVCAYMNFSKKKNGTVRPIFKASFNSFVQIIRVLMMGTAILLALASFITLCLSCYYYTKLSALGKVVILFGIGMTTLLYLLAFIGFWSVYSRSMKMLCVNLLCLFFAIVLVVTPLVIFEKFGGDIQDGNSATTHKMAQIWMEQLKKNPSRICDIQNELQCSGFNNSCGVVIGSSIECPINCEKTNAMWLSPCQLIISNWVANNYKSATSFLLFCALLLCIAFVFYIICWIALWFAKASIQKANMSRVSAKARKLSYSYKTESPATMQSKYGCIMMIMSLSSNDTARMKVELGKIHTSQEGFLNKQEMMSFFNKSLFYTASKDEIDEIFNICDINGDGLVHQKDLLSLQNPHKKGNKEAKKIIRSRLRKHGLLESKRSAGPYEPPNYMEVFHDPSTPVEMTPKPPLSLKRNRKSRH